jgi:hypothetical protein
VIFTIDNFTSETAHTTAHLQAEMSSTNSSDRGLIAESGDLNPMKEGSSPKKKFFSFRTVALILITALLSFLVFWAISQSDRIHNEVDQQSSKLGGYFCPPRRNYQDSSSTIGIYIKAFLASLMLISVSHRVAGYLCGIVVRHCLCKIPGSFQVTT